MNKNKKKFVLTAGLGLLSCSLLTSCDYSNFSLFGLFYNIYLNYVEKQYTKPNAGNSGNTSSDKTSSGNTETEVFVPQVYRVVSTQGNVKSTQQLTLLNQNRFMLVNLKREETASSNRTVSSFNMLGTYTRQGNVVSLSLSTNVFVDRSGGDKNVVYTNGHDEASRKAAFLSAYNTDVTKFVVKTDGTFALGDNDNGATVATGISTINTYFEIANSRRPTVKMVSLIDDSNYFVNSFAMDSKNAEMPVSTFLGCGTYSTCPSLSTDDYDVVKFKDGLGYMYASNNGSDMEFDLTSSTNFDQWWGLSMSSVHTYNLTKKGYEAEDGSTISPYGFEVREKDEDDGSDEPDVPEKEILLALEGEKNKEITLTLYKDSTYVFAWEKNKVSEEGSWSYDLDSDTLTLTAGENHSVVSLAKEDKSGYTIHYVYSKSDQLTQDYTISKADWENSFQILLELKGDVKAEIGLTLYKGGTYTFAYTGTPAKESGSYSYDADKDALTLTIGEKTYSSKKNADGSYTIHYVYSKNGQLTQDYTIPKSVWDATFGRNILTLKGQKNGDIKLQFKADNTYHFLWDANHIDESGTWTIDDKGFVTLTCEDKVNTFTKSSDGYHLAYVAKINAGLTQNYVLDTYNYNVLVSKSLLKLTGQKSKDVSISFLADHTYSFDFTLSGHTGQETGGWSYDSATDKVTLTCKDKVNTMSKQEDGSYKLDYVSKLNDSLTQTFVTYDTSFRQTFPHIDAQLTTSSTTRPYFNFNSDGSYEFGFAAYYSSEKGTFSYDERKNQIDLLCQGKSNTFTFDETKNAYVCDYVSNLSEKMTQTFTLEFATSEKILNKTVVHIDKTNTSGTKFGFDFYKNHNYKFSFVTYGVNEFGTWSYDSANDKFVFLCNNTKNEATKQNDGTYLIHYVSDKNSSMNQDYVLTAADAAKLIALD